MPFFSSLATFGRALFLFVNQILEWSVVGSSQGFLDGNGTSAQFNAPQGLAATPLGIVYVADTNNNRVRKIERNGNVTTYAGSGADGSSNGNGTNASFFSPRGIAIDSSGNVFVADLYNGLIRKIDTNREVTTYANIGTHDIDISSDGTLYTITDFSVQKLSTNGTFTRITGANGLGYTDGASNVAQFYYPTGVAVDSNGTVYVGDTFNGVVRKVSPLGVVSTLASGFSYPGGLVVDSGGNVYVGDNGNSRVCKITPSGVVSTVATGFGSPYGVSLDSDGVLYVSDIVTHRITNITQ
jgi:sugar lactone lactonase YvrE